jgi:hypothetical protein
MEEVLANSCRGGRRTSGQAAGRHDRGRIDLRTNPAPGNRRAAARTLLHPRHRQLRPPHPPRRPQLTPPLSEAANETPASTNHRPRRVLLDRAGRLLLRPRPEPERERLPGGRAGHEAEAPGRAWPMSAFRALGVRAAISRATSSGETGSHTAEAAVGAGSAPRTAARPVSESVVVMKLVVRRLAQPGSRSPRPGAGDDPFSGGTEVPSGPT